jgi:mRNA-degrading endonuclease toxin of MazEF toxin-antitoxin module
LLTAGDTFTIEGGHLLIVVKVCPHDQALLVRLTTSWAPMPTEIVVEPGEHPWVRRESQVFFQGTGVAPAAKIEALRDHKSSTRWEQASPELLKKITDAIPRSLDCPPRTKRFVTPECCP